MNLRNKNRFLALGAICLFSACSWLRSSTRDYFSPGFTCFAEPGFRNPADFQKYRERAWLPYRQVLAEENRRLGKSRVVFAGNSLVHLFLPELLQKEFPDQPVTNRGIGGDMTDTLLERLEEDVLSLAPQTLVLEIGGNDLIQGKCLSYIQSNVEQIVQKIQKKNPQTKILWMAVPPTLVNELNQVVPAYNLYLAELARKTKNMEYIEIWDEMREPNLPRIKDEYVRPGDPIHFNEKGYELWGRKLRPKI